MPHSNLGVSDGSTDLHKLSADRVIRIVEDKCKAAGLSTGRLLDVLSIINLVYDGEKRISGLIGIEIRTLKKHYVDKPYFRVQWKYLTPHNRSFRIFLQRNRDGTYIAQLYIRSKDILTEVTGSTWQELSLHLYMMLDQYKLLCDGPAPRRAADENRHHPRGYRKV